MLTARTQVLLTPEQRTRLERIARERGVSVGAVIRSAIESYIAPRSQSPEDALAALCALDAPVADWDRMKAEILAGAISTSA